MRPIHNLGLLGPAFLLALGAAEAADLPTHKPGYAPAEAQPAPAEAPLTPAPFTWTGPYLGVQAGYAWDGQQMLVRSVSNTPYAVERHGEFAGVVGGYDYQLGSTVFGVEADYNKSAVTGGAAIDHVYVATNRVNNFGSIDARLGHAFDRILVYGVGGLAFGQMDHTLDVPWVAFQKFSAFQTGYNWGFGAEYAFDNHWAALVELRHYHWFPRDFTAMPVLGPHNTIETLSIVKLGVVYRFGG